MRWCLLFVGVVLVGCVVPGGNKTPTESEVVPSGQGLLVLDLQTELEGRLVLGSAWSAEKADAYELLLMGTGVTRAVDAALGTGQVVAVDPGVWRVVLLAGVKRSSGSSTAYLAGSATAEAVTIVAGQRTVVSLVLRSIDLGLEAPGAALWKAGLTLRATGKTRNPRVGMQLSGSSTTNRPRLKSIDLWNGYREMASITGTPDDWSAEATGTVPDAVPSLLVQLIGAALCVQDGADQWVPTAGWTHYSWFWPNRADLTESHPLVPFTELTVPAGPPPTGVDVSVTWE